MLENYPSLLITKLYIPRVRSAHVSRSRLLATLDSGLDRKLILIAAAAGFGKTTLLADWSSQHIEQICWFSLDEGDNDPVRFLSYLVASIQVRRPQIGQELLAALQSPHPPAVDNVLPILINQLAALGEPLILIVDDYHVIENQAVHAAIAFLLDHFPPHISLVLLTRTDPPLPLARLRAKNDLLELRASLLRFSANEAAHFLNETMHLDLSDDSILALDTRTEGWIAGLQLAALALQALPDDKQTFVQNFTGSHRFILDYLIEEVLSHQPDSVRRFLLHTSILRRLNGSLCSTVTGESNGQAMIEHLERNNLFLVPLDQARYWYRYHHLFADLLLARLQAEDPAVLKELRQRAAAWHAANNLPEEAVSYALEARDFDYAAQLITGPALSVSQRGEVNTLLDWYRAFPAQVALQNPQLCLYFGVAFALAGRWTEAETLHDYAKALTTSTGDSLLLTYLIANYHHDSAQLAALAKLASAQIQPDRITVMVLALLASLNNEFERACTLMAEVQESSERAGDLSLAMTALFHRCRFHVYRGDFHTTYDLCQYALQRAQQIGSAALAMLTLAHSALGRILIEWNDLDNAVSHLDQAIRIAELSGFVTGTISSGTMMLAEVQQSRGDSEGANRLAQTAITYAERFDPDAEVFWLKTYQTRIWLNQGNLHDAAEWLRESNIQTQGLSLFYPYRIQRVAQARILLAQRKTEDAVVLLTRLTSEPRDLLSVEILALLALARQSQGDSVHALLMLEQAILLAQPENRIRVFLDLGAPMAKLLLRFNETYPDQPFVERLLTEFPAQPRLASSIDPLSDRELDVLCLIVAGHSNEEIAQNLTIAMSTVKWYINTLYGKLHVKTRSQAIARIHQLKLLE